MARKTFFCWITTATLIVGCAPAILGQQQGAPASSVSVQDTDKQINSLIQQGDTLKSSGKLRESEASYYDALQLAEKAHRLDLQASAQLKIANIAAMFGNYVWAAKAVDATIPLLSEEQSPDLLAEAMVRKGRYANRLNDSKTALAANLKALEIAQKRRNPVIVAEAANAASKSLVWYQKYDDAIGYAAAGLSLCSKMEGAASCYREALGNLTSIYVSRRDYARSCTTALASLGMARRAAESSPISDEEELVMWCLSATSHLDASISVGIGAVNIDQQRRALVADHIADVRSSFARSTASTYEELADELFQMNQIDEGEYVLDLLKSVAVGSSDPTSKAERKLLPVSKIDQQRIQIVLDASTAAAKELEATVANYPLDWQRLGLTDPDKRFFQSRLENNLLGLKSVDQLFAALAPTENPRNEKRALPRSSISSVVKSAGPGVMSLYTLTLWDHIGVALTTRDAVKYVKLKRDGKEVGMVDIIKVATPSIGEVRDSGRDPWDDLQLLYKIVIGSLGQDIKQVAAQSPDRIPTLIWSVDGVLRFLSINALFDGKQFFVEQARNVFLSPDVNGYSLGTPKVRSFRMLAAGKSEFGGFGDLQDLDEVGLELKSITRDPAVSDSNGPIHGQILLDNAFTVQGLVEGLAKKPDIIHLATHFIHSTGNHDNDSEDGVLLLTDGKDTSKIRKLSIADFQDSVSFDLSSVSLVTLSACSTGEANEISSLQDVDSLATVLRRRGASSVLAPQWKTDDEASRLFMSSFYTLWSSHPTMGKLEALRQTQLKMLNGEIGRKLKPQVGLAASPDPHLGFYAHPFYWATYQLDGDFR
jgi:CHAT domain-containing protein